MKNNAGSSLIEAVISAAILSIITIPIVSGFGHAYKSFTYSHDYYKAGLHAQNILCKAIYSKEMPTYFSEEEYETGKYEYIVYKCEINDGNISVYETYFSHDSAALESVTLEDKSVKQYKATLSGFLVIVDVYSQDGEFILRMLSPVESL